MPERTVRTIAGRGQDIDLLAGLLGGGSISGASGQRIKEQLEGIITSLNNDTNSKQRRIKFNLDVQGTKKSFSDGLKQITAGLSGQKQFKLKVSEIDASTALNSFKKQLESVLNTLKIDTGFSVTVGADGAVEAMHNIRDAADGATVSAGELKATLKEIDATNRGISSAYNAIKKELGSESATEEDAKTVNALKEKYLELTTAVENLRLKKDSASKSDIQNVYEQQRAMESLLKATRENLEVAKEDTGDSERSKVAALKQALSLYKQIDQYLKNNARASGTNEYEQIGGIRAQLKQFIDGSIDMESSGIS